MLDIGDPSLRLPEFLVLDASLVLELTPSQDRPHKHHALAANFLNRLRQVARSGLTIPLLPLLAFEECYFKLCQRVIAATSPKSEIWHLYYKKNPSVIQSVRPVLVGLYEALHAFPIEITEPEDIAIPPKGRVPLLATRMGDLINQFSVLPKDATILSEAERMGIFTVATLDSDWARADGFTVFAPL